MRRPLLGFFLFFVVIVRVNGVSTSRNYCPVSSRYHTGVSGYYTYPSLYWTKGTGTDPQGHTHTQSLSSSQSQPLNIELKLEEKPKEEAYQCLIKPNYGPFEIGTCVERSCVISSEEVIAALEVQQWNPFMNAICSLEEQIKKSLENPKTYSKYSINLIVIGGSMTHGSTTEGGCFCSHKQDSRCAEIDTEHLPEQFCSWVTHFVNWLTSEYPMIQFNVSDLSSSGLASVVVPDHIDPYFRQLTITDNDIIILDESVNDAGRLFNDLKQDVESMIRRLYTATRGSFPTIIMIEQFPHRSYFDGRGKRTTFETRILPGDYSIIYRNLSQHYGFIFYSLREVYWTNQNLNITESHRYPFTPFHDWHYNTHPPWYFHLFMADIVANCFLYSLSRCTHHPNHLKFTTYHLPSPYYQDLKTNDYCDFNSPYILDKHANNYFHPSNLKAYENGIVYDENSNELTQEFGWREYSDYHNISGWIINSKSDPSRRVLSFPLDNGAAGDLSSYSNQLVVVLFLKSYEGMGQFDVRVCGVPFGWTVDSLYKDYRTNRVSMPHMFAYQINNEQTRACMKSIREERIMEIVYRGDLIGDGEEEEVRKHKKVKILSVEVCKM